ncbi:ABC transporter ATP-binding protein [Lysinibacillus antri]|uniref:sn-glycerol-3-phosphate ABC transporter ATP-binding protein UgpC n=1 Tax=Lysinibacillus antri TaxID=2498145 RepID=A0A432LCJ3_9BACI|nr:sn-glycerol-3-phosphate ABC transporter ATP-binding protein UgpC [Lysinibacillus antri]RUL52236.1 sn-glycerol-3-phosphate ABC transporter ATP-binding protein UgpC [Lysinibacillus antri]
MVQLSLKNIQKQYNESIIAINNVNLEIEDKEFLVIVGPSGCGKSTLLKLIAGLEPVTDGEIYFNRQLINHLPPQKRDVAMVFQNYALYPHLTVFDNLAFTLKRSKIPKQEIKQRVESIASMLNLQLYLHKKPHELSGGQCQRVVIGRAIIRQPSFFLMDEPLSNLDAQLRLQMRVEITKLHKELESTFLYVTHDQTEALTMATRLVVMNEGTIQQVGSPEEVYNKPSNLFVAGFIGSPPMNFFEATINENVIQIGENSFEIPDKHRGKLQNKREVIIGIRPEHFHLNLTHSIIFHVNIDRSEFMGTENYVYATYNNQPLITRLPLNAPLLNSIQLSVQMEHVHFFDKETTNRISIEECR